MIRCYLWCASRVRRSWGCLHSLLAPRRVTIWEMLAMVSINLTSKFQKIVTGFEDQRARLDLMRLSRHFEIVLLSSEKALAAELLHTS